MINWLLQLVCIQVPIHLAGLIIAILSIGVCDFTPYWLIVYCAWNIFINPLPNIIYYIKKHWITQWYKNNKYKECENLQYIITNSNNWVIDTWWIKDLWK
jgi:hypothetical protein